jgi:hypothetical protein
MGNTPEPSDATWIELRRLILYRLGEMDESIKTLTGKIELLTTRKNEDDGALKAHRAWTLILSSIVSAAITIAGMIANAWRHQ